MKTYRGTQALNCAVQVESETAGLYALPMRLDIWNHSPTGFAWGYGGSGPAQLALAILADHTGDRQKAMRLHQAFKRDFVATFPAEWVLTSDQVENWIQKQA